jgi:hypothetical protein
LPPGPGASSLSLPSILCSQERIDASILTRPPALPELDRLESDGLAVTIG